MIPALILYLIRRFKGKINQSLKINRLKKLMYKLKAFLFSVIIISLFAFSKASTRKTLTYNVVKNKEVIGTIKINKIVFDDSVVYHLNSNINAKFILNFNVTGKEKSIYQNGILVYSSVFRTLNNKTKVNHEIVLKDGQYQLQSEKDFEILNFNSIKRNLITLYFKEPIGVSTVFCDNLKEMVPVKYLGSNKYHVKFSDSKHNIFHYKNGTCIKIEAVSTLFNVILIPATQ